MAEVDKPERSSEEVARFESLEKKLGRVRASLLEDPSLEELQRLQVHADLLENVLCEHTNTAHHHDTPNHHDHHTVCVTPGLEPRRLTPEEMRQIKIQRNQG